ncbi:MAG: CshA/CshB family fibrillar adhesin-related protein [Mucilaginibacter sp.]|uniref:CshA/CshB family fibrillar adhesin-related protein n=1 Tax=Mucilaginibacter sp. TaxID=1882438 RepID=UPI00326503DF
MTKTYLSKIILILTILCQFCTKAKAQYAIGGSAGVNLYNSVYWLTWGDIGTPGSTMISAPSGANAGSIINGTYIWQFSPTVRITAIVSNETFVGGVLPNMTAYTPGNYIGDGLDLIYSGNGQSKPFSRGVENSGLAAPYGGQVTFNIDVKVSILINGVYTDVVYPGMVIADAESIDSGGEFISGDTPNPVAWQLINKRTEGNAADDHYKMDLLNGGKSFKLYADLPPGNFGVQAVMFAHGARDLQNISMKGSGLTAMAIGFVLPFDLGDEPLSYGTAGHYMDQFQITDYYPGDGTYAVVNYNTTSLVAKASVYIGANNVDADGQPVGTALATNDDLVGADESTFNVATLPDIKVNQAGNVVLNLPVTNTKGVPATLYGWIDFNRDGVFSADEVVTSTIPANTNNQTFTLTFLNSTFASKIKTGILYTRFRITTTPLVDNTATPNVDERSFSFAADGEVEDYKFKDILGVNISGTVYNDHNGGTDGVISGTAIQYVGSLPLFAYLIDNTNTIANKATVQADGKYSLLNSNNGTYLVVISTNDVALGGSISGVQPTLPPGWKPSGEAYGLNNAGHTGIESGTPTLQIQVSTPGTSLDITGVNFALNQIPVTAADVVTTNINIPIVVDELTNDYDPDGTIDLTKVLLIDPADNIKKTVVTVAGQGTFIVNAISGRVAFTPVATFTGKAIIFYTIKDDYGSESLNTQITINVKPVGVNDVDQTAGSTPVTTIVKANDGASGTGNTVIAGTLPVHGAIVVNPSGTVTYTPNAGYTGNDTYTYTLVTPDGVSSDPISVTITVGASKPIGANDNDITIINTPVTTTVTTNDPGATGSTIAMAAAPAHGTAVIGVGGQITYTPTAGFMGLDTYTYTLTKAGVLSDPITVTIGVKPKGVNDVDQTQVNTPVTTTVKTNDGASGTGTTVTAGTAPLHGNIVVNASGTITYTPIAGYSGSDTYTYTLNTIDGVVSDVITVTLTINAKPVGADDAGVTPINTAISLTVTANDPDAAGSTMALASAPTHGTVVIGPGAGQITYTPAANFMGNDTYTYTLTKTGVISDSITVTISVKPVGANDADQTPINTPVTSTVKTNDGASGTGTTIAAGTAPLHGSIVVNASGTITYTPNAGYTGTDTYKYTLTTVDGVMSDPITVTITVSSKPIGAADIDNTSINTAVATTVIANDPSAAGSTVAVAGSAIHGTAVTGAGAGVITYTPAAGFIGKDTYTYTLTNGGIVSDPITVTINVKPVGVTDADQTSVNTSVTTTVKTNDGPSGTGTTVAAGTAPLHGSIVVNASGTITYTPTAGYVGTDSYTYTLTTADGVVSDQITVNITVGSKPVGANDTDTTPINTAKATTVTANDPSAAGSTVTVASAPSHGTALVGAGGIITYTPTTGFIGKDTYTYTLTNGGVLSDPITVTISVRPVGTADADKTSVNLPVTTGVINNDGASAVRTTVTGGTAPAHGTIVVNASGTITYTPATGYVGSDSYTYTLTTVDGVTSAAITVNITITLKPLGSLDRDNTTINTPVATNVIFNDQSAVGSTVSIATNPAHGTVVLGPGAGIITYTPASNFIGKDTYTYTLTNNGNVSDPITVEIYVAPVGVDDVDQTPVNTPITINVKANDGISGVGTTVVTQSTNPYFVFNPSGTVTYMPKTGFIGTDTCYYYLITPDGTFSPLINISVTTYTASMVLTKVANNKVSKVGDVINYTMIVYNTGTSALTNVTVADAGADAGSISPASIPGLAAGALTTVTAKHTITQADVDAGFYSNQASVSAVDVKGNVVLKSKSDNPLTISADDATVTIITVPPVVVVPKVLKIPTLFTPNGDGINDVFEIKNLNDYAQNELSIVNRWGNEVYKQTDYKNTWTGDGLNEGTYYYVLRIKGTGWLEWQVYKGYITLIRTFKK